jgi:hypothetical protein
MPMGVYVIYVIYVIYTVVYFYNRAHGKSAQFGVNRVYPKDSPILKFVVDTAALLVFFLISYAIFFKTFYD